MATRSGIPARTMFRTAQCPATAQPESFKVFFQLANAAILIFRL
jgi:hypothetical protein